MFNYVFGAVVFYVSDHVSTSLPSNCLCLLKSLPFRFQHQPFLCVSTSSFPGIHTSTYYTYVICSVPLFLLCFLSLPLPVYFPILPFFLSFF